MSTAKKRIIPTKTFTSIFIDFDKIKFEAELNENTAFLTNLSKNF